MTSSLKLMQEGLRLDHRHLLQMLAFVEGGGFFSPESLFLHDPTRILPIAICCFEDGVRYIRDGLHRVLVIHLAGRPLRSDEYIVENMTYDMFSTINLKKKWLTPFNPLTEMRTADFHSFKAEALKLTDEHKDYVAFIYLNKSRYCVPRNPAWDTIADVAKIFGPKLKELALSNYLHS